MRRNLVFPVFISFPSGKNPETHAVGVIPLAIYPVSQKVQDMHCFITDKPFALSGNVVDEVSRRVEHDEIRAAREPNEFLLNENFVQVDQSFQARAWLGRHSFLNAGILNFMGKLENLGKAKENFRPCNFCGCIFSKRRWSEKGTLLYIIADIFNFL